jgi:hypothetical protein
LPSAAVKRIFAALHKYPHPQRENSGIRGLSGARVQVVCRMLTRRRAPAYRSILLAHSGIEAITVFQYTSPPRLQQRIDVTDSEQKVIDEAVAMKGSESFPFWERVFAICARTGECSDELLRAAFFHHGQGSGRVYGRDALTAGILEQVTRSSVINVSLGSQVEEAARNHRPLHMLDFNCPLSTNNTNLVHRICRQLIPRGFVLLDSGDSYHVASIDLCTYEERVETLARALLVSPIVDVFYVGHQLLQSSSWLRISRGGRPNQVPTVLDVWHST